MGTSSGTVVDGLNHTWNEPLSGKREIDQKHNHTCIEGVEFGNNHRGEQVRWQVEGIYRNAKVQQRSIWEVEGICRSANVQQRVCMGSAQYIEEG